MVNLYKFYLSMILLIFGMNLIGQPPSYVYEGGNGGGFSFEKNASVNVYFYKGGNGGGFASANNLGVNAYFYMGGDSDGFTSVNSSSGNAYFYNGGNKGGYTWDKNHYTGTTFYEGDIGEGYDMEVKCQEYVWTGTVGTGWGVEENWNYNVVPDIGRPVIIPAGAPNYPNVNAGILAIGDNPNGGAFVCKSIWVQSGGELITRLNNFVENYGELLIDGNVQVKNSAANAIQNFQNGVIRISPSGTLIIKP